MSLDDEVRAIAREMAREEVAQHEARFHGETPPIEPPVEPPVVADIWATQPYGNFLGGPPTYEFTDWANRDHTVFSYPTDSTGDRQAYRDAVKAAGYNVIVMTWDRAEFADKLEHARLLADELRADGFLVIAFLGNEVDSLNDLIDWFDVIVPIIDGANTALAPLWEPPDADPYDDLAVTWADGTTETVRFSWRMDDALVERMYRALRAVGERVAAGQNRRPSPRCAHGPPAWWNAGVGLRNVDLTAGTYEYGYDERPWLAAMRDNGLDWYLMQERLSDSLWEESTTGDESDGQGALFWYLGYRGAASHEPGHFNRICNALRGGDHDDRVGAMLFEFTRDGAQHAEAVGEWRRLMAEQDQPDSCNRGIM